jgi:TonB family protein
MKKQFLLIAGLAISGVLVLSTTLSSAQQKREAAPGEPMRVELPMQSPDAPPPPGDFVFIANEMSFSGRLVKNAPYSATAVTESIQTLSDGNRIISKSTSALYRDSEGRTRREQSLGPIGAFASGGEPQQMIFIDDPVSGVSYTLDARTRSAQKMPPMRFKFEFKTAPPAGEGVGGTPGPAPPAPDQQKQFEFERIERSAKVTAEAPRYVWGWRNHEATTESLGKQNIEGVEADGTRGKLTIPAGEIGNERAIEITDERWYSPELQTVVMTRHSDPRFGESSYRLTNISRSEPPKSLFELPGDYTVSSGGGNGMGGFATGGGESRRAGGENRGAFGGFPPGGVINGGALNGKAVSLPIPPYPSIARAAHASGSVKVQITVDEEGSVISAQAVSGHPLLQAAAVAAARNAKFSPTKVSGQPVKVQGVLIYNFVE